jgi:hypothetical protein
VHAEGTFEIKSWEEQPYSETAGRPKLTHIRTRFAYQGGISGESTLQYLMFYRDERSGSFIGLEHVTGRMGELTGSFVLEHRGIFEGGVINVKLSVVEGSASGDLRGLRGQGRFTAKDRQMQVPFEIDYEFEK